MLPSVKFLILFASLLPLVSSSSGEETLENVLKELRTNFKNLKGYHVTYEVKTEKGKTATFRQGEEPQSGWAFATMVLRDTEGKIIGERESWATGDDHYLVKHNDTFVNYEGLASLMKGLRNLAKGLQLEHALSPLKIHTACNLTPSEVNMILGLSTSGPIWLQNIEGLISTTEKEVTLDWGELGIITVNRSNGILTSQIIKVGKGVREMKLVKSKINLDEGTLAGLMELDPTDAAQRTVTSQLGLEQILHEIYQALIRKTKDDPEFGDTLKTNLSKTEDQLVSFLHLQLINPARKKRILSLLETIDRIGADLEKGAKAKGQDIDRRQLFANKKIREFSINKLASQITEKCKEDIRKASLKEALGKQLTANGRIVEKARFIIEDAILTAYFRVDLEKALLVYFKQNR